MPEYLIFALLGEGDRPRTIRAVYTSDDVVCAMAGGILHRGGQAEVWHGNRFVCWRAPRLRPYSERPAAATAVDVANEVTVAADGPAELAAVLAE